MPKTLRPSLFVMGLLLFPALALSGVTNSYEAFTGTVDTKMETARLHYLTPEMEEWLAANVHRGFNKRQTMTDLLETLQDDELGLSYENTFTGNARDVFEEKRFNCLSFAHLFVAMARHMGIDAYYYSVSRAPRYGREGDLVVVSEHVTAAYGNGSSQLTLRFAFDEEIDYAHGTPLTDSEALALHFSNQGAKFLMDGNTEEAISAFRVSTEIFPTDGSLWVNLGVGLRRFGDFNGAEAAYLQASRVEPGHLPAYHNLHALMVSLGKSNVARELIDLLDRRANRNPFTYLNLGDTSLSQGRFEEAYRFYRRALSLGARSDGRAAMGSLALAQGDVDRAEHWLTKARAAQVKELDAGRFSPSHRVVALAEKLAGGQ